MLGLLAARTRLNSVNGYAFSAPDCGYVGYTRYVRSRFSRSSCKHRIGRAHALAALANAGVPTAVRDDAAGMLLRWIGLDDRGIELELTGFVADEDSGLVIIIHVMPAAFRGR